MQIVIAPGMDPSLVKQLMQSYATFFSICQGIHEEDESVGYFTATSTQQVVLDAMDSHPWVIVDKFRQAKTTTVVALTLLLRDCMYLHGMKGVLIAESEDTAKDIFERITTAWHLLPAEVKMPLAPGRPAGVKEIHFVHGGSIKVLTAGGQSPGIGRGIGRLHVTELGEVLDQRKLAVHLFPTVFKRPGARVVIESTPGRLGSHHQSMWEAALAGTSRLHPVFLKWWLDPSAISMNLRMWARRNGLPDGEELVRRPEAQEYARGLLGKLTEDEKKLLQVPGMTYAHLAFRRETLATGFDNDPRLFASKYPMDEYDGWLGAANPVLPRDDLARAGEGAVATPDADIEAGCGLLPYDLHPWVERKVEILAPHHPGETPDEPQVVGHRVRYERTVVQGYRGYHPHGNYLVAADPAGFGDDGDPAGLIVFYTNGPDRWVEVGVWEGREDPAAFARRLARVSDYFGRAVIVVESNASASVAVLRELGARVFYENPKHPGWYATQRSLGRAEGLLVQAVREGTIQLRSRRTLNQLMHYDGALRRKRVASSGDPEGRKHHFELARCALIGVDVLSRFSSLSSNPKAVRDLLAGKRPDLQVEKDGTVIRPVHHPGVLTWRDVDAKRQQEKAAARSPYRRT